MGVESFLTTMNDYSFLFNVIPNSSMYTSLIAGVVSSVVKVGTISGFWGGFVFWEPSLLTAQSRSLLNMRAGFGQPPKDRRWFLGSHRGHHQRPQDDPNIRCHLRNYADEGTCRGSVCRGL